MGAGFWWWDYGVREYLFVEMDSYAIALYILSLWGLRYGVTRWGLFLRRGC